MKPSRKLLSRKLYACYMTFADSLNGTFPLTTIRFLAKKNAIGKAS